MRVLVLFPRFGIGGIAKASSFVANTYQAEGYDVTCLSMSDDEKMQVFNPGIKTVYIPYEKANRDRVTLFDKLSFLLNLRRYIAKNRFDWVVALGTDLVRIAYLASWGTKSSLIGSERGNPYLYSKHARRKYIKALSKCKRVVFQTEEARNYYPMRIQRLSEIIPNPCYNKGNAPIVKSDLSQKTILVVGRLSEEKNVMGIIKAFAKVQSIIPEYKLYIYGDGNQRDLLINYVSKEKISNVYFWGNAVNPFDTCRNASLFIINSNTEGMPNSLIEAMMYGIPCIATDCPPGGVRFLADKGRRVCLVPVGDEKALSEAMIKIATNEEYKRELVSNSAEILKELDPQIIGKEWVDLLNEYHI